MQTPPRACLVCYASIESANSPRTISALSQPRGEVAEWLKAPHSKCGIRVTVSGVRIPPSPPRERASSPQSRTARRVRAFGIASSRWLVQIVSCWDLKDHGRSNQHERAAELASNTTEPRTSRLHDAASKLGARLGTSPDIRDQGSPVDKRPRRLCRSVRDSRRSTTWRHWRHMRVECPRACRRTSSRDELSSQLLMFAAPPHRALRVSALNLSSTNRCTTNRRRRLGMSIHSVA